MYVTALMHTSLYFTRLYSAVLLYILVKVCHVEDVCLLAYSPLAMGLLTVGGV